MEASIKRTSLEVMGDIGPREEEASSDTENHNGEDVFRCGKCDLQFQSSYHLHHHIAYTHAGIALETAERLPNPYPVEPLALNLKHSNRVDSPVLNKSRDTSPLSKPYRKSSQSVALDLSKPPSNSSEALDLSTTKLQSSLREVEVTGYRRSQGEITPSNNPHQRHHYEHTTFEKGYKNDLGKAAADEMVKRGQFLVDNKPDVDDSEAGDRLVIDCSNVTNYEHNLKDGVVAVTSSQPHGNSADQLHNDRGHIQDSRQGHNHAIQGRGMQSESQGQVSSQSRDHLPQGQGLLAGSEAERFNSLPFPFNLQQHMMMMNGGGASPPISNYSMMTPDLQQSLMSFQQQLSPFMKGKPGPVKATKVNRRARVKAADLQEDKSKAVVEIYECKVCNRKFSQVGNFHNHMKLHSTKVCVCGICKIEFLDSYELQRHMRKTHTGDMPYKCEQCDREFSQYNNLRRHLRVHNGKSYKCHICGRTFNEVFYLEMHIGSHTGERTYSCGVCSLSFRDNAELQRHVQTHSAAELHTCEVCGKSFSKACVLRQHKKMHSGLRPFKCDICDKAFIHRHHLKIHSRMHSTDKPYRCKICGKDFAQTSHLYKHVRQHAQKTSEDDSDVCTQAEIQALYPGLCQGSRGTPSPLAAVSDLSQSSGSPVNSPLTEGECNGVPSGRSPSVKDSTLRSDVSDIKGENGGNDLNMKAVRKYEDVDNKIAAVGCDDTYKFDGGVGLDANRAKEEPRNRQMTDLKCQEESTASDTMESDPDTESGELSPHENERQHDYRQFDITDGVSSRGDNHLDPTDFSYKDSVHHPGVSNTSTCEDFSKHIKEECGQMSQNMDDIKNDHRLGVKMEDAVISETSREENRESHEGSVKPKYSIEHLLKDPSDQKQCNSIGSLNQTESELYDRKFCSSKIGLGLHHHTGLGLTPDQHHTTYSNTSVITESHVKSSSSQQPTDSSNPPFNPSHPSFTVLDIHMKSNPERSSHDLQQYSFNAGRHGQGHLDQPSTRLSEAASPVSSDHLSVVSSLETEMARSRSSSLESEDKISRSYKKKVLENTREEDVTSSTDDHTVSHSDVKAGQQREDNSLVPNLQPSQDVLSKAVYQSDGLSSDRSSPHNKPKQKRRRRQNSNKVVPPEQNYLPLIPNLGIDPQQMYLLQLHQMQMAMAASMAAGAQMYPFPGSRMMPTGNFDPYSPEISHRQDFNRERSRSQSPQVARSHDLHRQEGLIYPPSISPRNKDVNHSGSPTSASSAPSDHVTSSHDEMMRYMLIKREMASNTPS